MMDETEYAVPRYFLSGSSRISHRCLACTKSSQKCQMEGCRRFMWLGVRCRVPVGMIGEDVTTVEMPYERVLKHRSRTR